MLLCNPFGEEASRAHRTYRVLATQLERAGFAALRFDYTGTGDSLGDGRDATLAMWRADLAAAADRLREVSGASRLAVVGLRLGGTLAVLASAAGDLRARHLLLWDPVVRGATYLRELIAQHRAYMRQELGPRWRDRLVVGADGIPAEALGAPISPALGRELTQIDLMTTPAAVEQLTVVTTKPTTELTELRAHLPASARWVELAESPAWNSDAALNAMTVPMDIVQAIIARIEETSP